MADHLATAAEEVEEAESHSALYIRVWVALLVLTVLEYFYAKLMAGSMASLIVGLMALACIKAALVGWYFMHVKFEGKWIWALIIPAGILATVLIGGLIPDIALSGDRHEPDEETSISTPHSPTSDSASSTRLA